jgi:hypothetical protein
VNPRAAVQRPAAGPASPPRQRPRTPFVLGAVAVLAVLLISQFLAAPHVVSRVTIDNPGDYGALVEVADAQGHDWFPIGTIERHGSTSFEQVYDVGNTWRFRLSAQTVGLGVIKVSRAQLERSNWHVEIPTRIGDTLRERNIKPQP